MNLAIFDLDNTLLAGDSDHLWGDFLGERGMIDGDHYRSENNRFLVEYNAGTLDIDEFLRFSLRALAATDPTRLAELREEFLEEKIAPIIAPGAPALLDEHRGRGDRLMIITATNRFVTEPIAQMLGVEVLLATEPEVVDGIYTGEVAGVPCFRDGKVTRLHAWLAENPEISLTGSHFYSDSHNDIPLLKEVDHPVAVDPDDELREFATKRDWPVITLRDPEA